MSDIENSQTDRPLPVERISLTEKDSVIFLAALANPPEPNEALKAAAARYRRLTERKI